MKYFSMFSGIGGFELGILYALRSAEEHEHEASISSCEGQRWLESNSSTRLACIGYSEIDKYAVKIYQKHFKGHRNYGDATRIIPEELPDFDLLVGGFPCQAFSVAGKRRGFDDTRGTMFFEIARILRVKRPGRILLENVKGLLNHDGGKTFQTILKVLSDIGYCVEWQVLNSKDFGVPQNRERVFIVGHLGERCGGKVFPIGQITTKDSKQGNVEPISGTLSTKNQSGQAQWDGSTTLVGTLRTHKDGEGFRRIKECVSPAIPARAREDGSGQPVIAKNMKIRRLTPTECERLQGFPDGWTEFGIVYNSRRYIEECAKKCKVTPEYVIGRISDTQRYKCLGNAVTVNVIEAIITKWLKERKVG